jgi:hypothetical protein
MIILFKKKMGIKELQVMFVSKPLKEPLGFMKEPYGYVDGYLTFSPPKKVGMVKSLAALCTVSSEQATLYNILWLCLSFFFCP